MPSVIFDYTRVTSALGHSSGRPELVLANLAKLVEAIVLCDSIFTTENVSLENMGRRVAAGKGFYDLSKTYIYDPIFTKIFKKVPADVDERLGREHHSLPRENYIGQSWLTADLAVLEDAKARVSGDDFQFLDEKTFSEAGLLSSLERVRVLTSLGREMRAPYDPVPFRAPLVGLSMPGNLNKKYLRPFREFERGVEAYIEELIDDQGGFKFPLLLAIVLRECRAGAPDDVYAVALQLREDPLLERLRQLLDEHVAAYSALDLRTLAKTDRIIRSELGGIKRHLSGELPAEFKLSLKPSWFPLGVGWEVKQVLQHYRDRRARLPLANLARMTNQSLDVFGELRNKIFTVLSLEIPEHPR